MSVRKLVVLCAVSLLAALALCTAALAAASKVTVRVEGRSHTLLAATTVRTQSGSITKGGIPPGLCPKAGGAGALDAATHHRWNGTYSTGLGINVTQILGETHRYAPNGFYWSIWVDNTYAPAGICDLKLHPGEQLLFAPYPAKGSVHPLKLTAPAHVTIGHPFKLKVVYYDAKGKAKPLAGVRLEGAVTNRQGIATVTAGHRARLKLTASRPGYIRSPAVTVRVAG